MLQHIREEVQKARLFACIPNRMRTWTGRSAAQLRGNFTGHLSAITTNAFARRPSLHEELQFSIAHFALNRQRQDSLRIRTVF